MRLAYYPGCSSMSSSIDYHLSISDISEYLGISLHEVEGWTCCGASSGHIVNKDLAISLAGRNLALAEKMSLDLVTSCPNCFLRLKTAQHELSNDSGLKAEIEKVIDSQFALSITVKHILQVIHDDLGIKLVREKVKNPLKGLKGVMYYGCYLVRPPAITQFDDPEVPVIMDRIMEALDLEVVDWCHKIDCCGGGALVVNPEVATHLATKIVQAASDAQADIIVTACPMCQSTLEVTQLRNPNTDQKQIPVVFFSELMALAFDSPSAQAYLEKHLIPLQNLSNLK